MAPTAIPNILHFASELYLQRHSVPMPEHCGAGCWELECHAFGADWYFAFNPHNVDRVCSRGHHVPATFGVIVTRNGFAVALGNVTRVDVLGFQMSASETEAHIQTILRAGLAHEVTHA